jgi:serine/threonine protein kinase
MNNINNNLLCYNEINNINHSNNGSISKKNNNNYPTSYKKKINKNSESTTIEESEQNTKNNKNSINRSITNSSKKVTNNNNQKDSINQKFKNFSEYKIIKQIGKGTFGQIFMVENSQHQKFALKKLIATNLKDIKTLEHEYQILLDIQTYGKKINLVQIYGIETKQLDPTTFIMYVLMELASTDWEKEILTRHNMNEYYSENELMTIISSLITTFAQLQKEKISHRDIKPQNILIFEDSKTYKLADFGEAKELLEDDKPTERQTLRGTELYMSPKLFYALRSRQVIKYVKHNPYKSDLFSFGLCCLFAATLCFESIYDIRELRNNTAIKFIIQKYLGSRYSNVVIDIICSMLDVNENSRNDFIEMEKEIKKIGY